jgi:thiosulfate/3-mercaptopyruvate sulfurtransferase
VLDAALRGLGITTDTTVVLYGRDTEGDANEKWPGRRAGQIAATRALMILTYAGVQDVRLLDGGYDWWVRAGHPVETVIREASPVARFGAVIPVRPEVIVDIDEAKQILDDPDGAALVSVRTWREHIGAVSGYNYIGPAGRIKGDVWGNCGSDAYHMQHYRNVDNTMRAYPEITANWAEAGIVRDKWVAYYCGTGWRASETWFYAFLQEWPRVAVYDGGWFEWSQDPASNPIEIGVPDVETPKDVYAA